MKRIVIVATLLLGACDADSKCTKFKIGEIATHLVVGKVQIVDNVWIGQCMYDARIWDGTLHRFREWELQR